MKKVLCLFIAVFMIISAMASVTAVAATQEVYKLDFSTYTGVVVEEDGKQAAVIGKSGEKYTVGETEYTLGGSIGVKNDAGVLPEGTQGIVINTTFKLTSTSPQIILLPTTGVYPRYIDLSGSTIKYNGNGEVGQINTQYAIAANVWYDLTYKLNYKTGYLEIVLTDLSTGTVRKHVTTDADFILTDEKIAAIKTIRWWHTGNASGNMFISKFEVYAEDDVEAIAPSKIVVRDNFDSASGTVSSPWTTTTTEVVETDRGNSAILGNGHKQYLGIKQTSQILPSKAKGFVSEFAVKLTGATKHGFIYALNDSNNNYWSANLNLIKFAQNGNIQVNGQKSNWSTWSKNVWYDIRIEYNFADKVIRYTISDGSTEKTASYTNTYTNYDDLSGKVQLQFVSENQDVDQNILIDDVNIYWIDELTASGITMGADVASVNNRFEDFATGSEAITTDMTCGAPKSFWGVSGGGSATYAVEEVPGSGRGKSFKATADLEVGQNQSFYKDFGAIQNGVVSFDIMFTSQKGLTLISAQTSEADNSDSTNTVIFRFDNWGNIKDGGNKNVIGYYTDGEWYKVVLTAGVYNEVSGVKYQIYGSNGLAAEGITNTNSGEICRDSIRYGRIYMHDYDNTLYVDNYKAYAPSATPYGIYPVAQADVKGSTLSEENKIKLAFSKNVDIAKSKFTVNGEAVTANGTDLITLNKELEAGEVYNVEYTVYDADGYRTFGYVPGISVESVYNVSNYTEATLDNPVASATVRIGKGAGSKDVVLYVAAYSGNKLVSVRLDPKTADSEGVDLSVAADCDGADSVKTFLWSGTKPIK